MRELVALGINGWIPSHGRQTMCFLLLDGGEEVFLLDAGTGLSRLLQPEFRQILASRKRLNIILSHYHLDHVAGLTYLPAVWSNKPLRLYAPEEPFVEVPARSAVGRLLNPPLFPLSFSDFPARTRIIPVNQAEMEIGGHDFTFHRLAHGGGAMGMKIDGILAYITDTYVDEGYFEFIDGVRFLMHEVWVTREESRTRPEEAARHSMLEEVTDLAARCSVKKLMPIHLNPRWDNARVEELMSAARSEFAGTISPGEGEAVDPDD